ncbi:MAG TPA: efflux RND transporter periplasmic adaptor subunit [Planctomycetes bacterium]|nr:efflux RND transporter periplasmic adaptor subunit [Planctomycetota bacterium]
MKAFLKTFVKFFFVLVVGAALALGGYKLVKLRKKQLASIRIAPVRSVPVETGKVRSGEFVPWRPYIGRLESNRQALLKARASGTVSRILKREGEKVLAGEPLVELEGTSDKPLGSRLALAETIRRQKEAILDTEKTGENLLSILKRTRDLFEKKMASLDQVQLLENQVASTRARIADLKRALASFEEKLSFYTVPALFDGVVSRVKVNLGDVVMPSQPLLELEDPSPCKVRTTVSTEDLRRLSIGAPVRIGSGKRTITAKITRIYPSARDLGVGTVEAALPAPPFGLPLGATVAIDLPVKRIPHTLAAPMGCVLAGPKLSTVFKIEEGKVRVVKVKVLASSPEEFAIQGDLKPGDLLVKGSDSLLMRLAGGTAVTPVGESHD